jgi:hypothetical protein
MKRNQRFSLTGLMIVGSLLLTSACTPVNVPDPRNVSIPAPTTADPRSKAINERPDSVMYLPLGEDVLVPEVVDDEPFPSDIVGPFELRGETLAGALQLILSDYDVSLAFESEAGLSRRITVANLRGDLGKVINQVCSLANLYCSYEDGTITVKDTQTFTVTLPPIGGGDNENAYLTNVSSGLAAILGQGAQPIVDATTRTIVYSATQRTANVAARYFQRLRANTAMIIFETYIWEVSLNAGNSTGIDWNKIDAFGKFNVSLGLDGQISSDFSGPISIGLPTTQNIGATPTDLISFLSQFGAVKTISQPQITVLSGSSAELRVADTDNYVSEVATTFTDNQSTTSVSTDSVDTGFTLTIGSSWDKSTVYANVEIELTDVKAIDDFTFSDGGANGQSTVIQLPQTSERQLTTQVRVRPGDSVLIAGLVRENDNFDTKGLGFMKPIVPDSRTAQTENLELVIMLRPRVIIYTSSNDQRYVDFAMKKHHSATAAAATPQRISPASTYQSPSVSSSLESASESLGAPAPLAAPAPLTAPAPKVEAAPKAAIPARTSAYTAPAPLAPVTSVKAPEPISTVAPVTVTPLPAEPAANVSPSWERSSTSTNTGSTSVYNKATPASVYPAPAPVAADNKGLSSPYETYDYYRPPR